MTTKFLTHSFDARSVLLFASIAVTSAMAPAQTLSASAAAKAATPTSRMVQVDRHLQPSDPRRHQQRQPVKKNL